MHQVMVAYRTVTEAWLSFARHIYWTNILTLPGLQHTAEKAQKDSIVAILTFVGGMGASYKK